MLHTFPLQGSKILLNYEKKKAFLLPALHMFLCLFIFVVICLCCIFIYMVFNPTMKPKLSVPTVRNWTTLLWHFLKRNTISWHHHLYIYRTAANNQNNCSVPSLALTAAYGENGWCCSCQCLAVLPTPARTVAWSFYLCADWSQNDSSPRRSWYTTGPWSMNQVTNMDVTPHMFMWLFIFSLRRYPAAGLNEAHVCLCVLLLMDQINQFINLEEIRQ